MKLNQLRRRQEEVEKSTILIGMSLIDNACSLMMYLYSVVLYIRTVWVLTQFVQYACNSVHSLRTLEEF